MAIRTLRSSFPEATSLGEPLTETPVCHLVRGILAIVGGLACSIGRLPDRICGRISSQLGPPLRRGILEIVSGLARGIGRLLTASVGRRDQGSQRAVGRKAAERGHSGDAAVRRVTLREVLFGSPSPTGCEVISGLTFGIPWSRRASR